MPRKDKEKYNEYMRNYMLKKNRELKGKPVLDDDYNPSQDVADKPTLDLNSATDLVKKTQELLKSEKGNPDADDDPVLKAINKYGKYIPIAMEFFKGFQAAAADFKQKDQANQAPKIQAPDGWLHMTPMQKLGLKYSRSEWYAAGEAYDAAVESGNFNPMINPNYVDKTYQQPQNLQALARKYPEPPMVSDSQPLNTPAPSPTNDKSGDQKPVQQVDGNKSSDVENSEKEKLPTEKEALVAELQEDNRKYIQMGINYINGMSDADFKKNLNDIDSLVIKAKPFIPFIPVHVKAMIVQSKKEELEEIFKNGCPQKYKIVVTSKKLKKLLDLFEGLQKLL